MVTEGNKLLRFLALVFLAAGLCALFYLLKLRFEAGDSLPRGSSLRSDPLGIEVLFESINRSGIAVAERNYLRLEHAPLPDYDTVVFSHAAPPCDGKSVDVLQSFVTNRGGRLLFTLAPQSSFRSARDKKPDQRPRRTEKSAGRPHGDERETQGESMRDDSDEETPLPLDDADEGGCPGGGCVLRDYAASNLLWRSFAAVELPSGTTNAVLHPSYEGVGGYALPPTLPVKTAVGLSTNLLAGGWRTVYACGGIPVVAERTLERGSVVISALSYPFSNEAVRSERATDFLLWALGDGERILFDESHFGLVISRTAAKYIRRNDLHFVLLALLIPALLYLWHASVTLLPRYADEEIGAGLPAVERGSGALERLLMRAVQPEELIDAALERWCDAHRPEIAAMPPAKIRALEELRARHGDRKRFFAREREVVAAYNEAAALVNEDFREGPE